MSTKKCRKKHFTKEEKQEFVVRLNKIEGQARGIKQMIEMDRSCDDILIQLLSVRKAAHQLGNCIVKSHLETCTVDDIKKGNTNAIDDLFDLVKWS